jgi:hypothetical protein
MTYDPHPLHPSLIKPADELYRIDLTEHTQETLRRRAEQTHPTMSTTRGRREWRWGRRVDRPSSTNAPLIMSPSDLERAPTAEPPSKYGSLDELLRRLKP